MNIKTTLACALLAAFTQASLAQEYLTLKQNDVIYDVDVIVFARNLAQPATESVKKLQPIKTESVKQLAPWNGESELILYPQTNTTQSTTTDEWQVPIEEQAPTVKALSWVIMSNSMNHPLINRLSANPTFKPLYRQKWRQPASSFNAPMYIEVSNLPQQPENQFGNTYSNDSRYNAMSLYDDFSIDGQVAFSQQRFSHLHVKMNLYRQNFDGDQILYEISQKKQVELNEWNYFDHQQFGILAKVTAVSLKPGSE